MKKAPESNEIPGHKLCIQGLEDLCPDHHILFGHPVPVEGSQEKLLLYICFQLFLFQLFAHGGRTSSMTSSRECIVLQQYP